MPVEMIFAIGSGRILLSLLFVSDKTLSWTNGQINPIAGIGPSSINSSYSHGSETGKLEEAAKDNDKDSISLCKAGNTLKLTTFGNAI